MTTCPMASEGNGDTPVDRLANLIDSLDHHMQAAEGAVRRSEGNRISILYVHSVFALMIAPAFAAVGTDGMTGPIWAVMRQVPGAPHSVAFVMFLGGMVLTVATTLRNRQWELVGLGLLILWYGTVSLTFTGAVLLWLFNPTRGPAPGFYAPLVYAHFLVIMLVHCHTLRRMIRAHQGRWR